LLYGILLILIILLEPDGLVGLLRKIFRRSSWKFLQSKA